MKALINVTLILSSMALYANTSLNWQKVSLEDKIRSKVDKAVGGVLKDGQYLIEVEVAYNDPGSPNFEGLNKIGTRVSDTEFDDSKGDYIAFSKVGLEVPVVEKQHQQHQKNLQEVYRFNQAYDLFRHMESVKVTIVLSDLLKPEIVAQVKGIIENVKYPTGEIIPQVAFKSISMEIAKVEKKIEKKKAEPLPQKKKDDGLSMKDILDFISRFGNAIGLITATLLLGAFGYLLLKKYLDALSEIGKNVEGASAEKLEEELEDELAQEAEEDHLDETTEIDQAFDFLFESTPEQNFDRFVQFLHNSRFEALSVVKKWINQDDEATALALNALVQQLAENDLNSLFIDLNDMEREKWKNSIEEFIEKEEIEKANKFIAEEVIREMVGPSPVQDLELLDMLLGLPTASACRFVLDHPNDAAILLNLLPPKSVGRILEEVEASEVERVIESGMNFQSVSLVEKLPQFKQTLQNFINNNQAKPFNHKLLKMLKNFSPGKEKMLYQFLARGNMVDEIRQIAKQNLPSELITRLPGSLLKNIMQSYPMNKKVELLFSLEEEARESLLSSFAEVGSTSREMIDLEFNNLSSDLTAQNRINNTRDQIWADFVDFSRSIVKLDEEYKSDIDALVVDWIKRLSSEKEQAQAA